FLCRRKSERSGNATSFDSSPDVATWYRRGTKVWWLLRSTRVTSTAARLSLRAASTPPKPPPMMTTRGLVIVSPLPSSRRSVHWPPPRRLSRRRPFRCRRNRSGNGLRTVHRQRLAEVRDAHGSLAADE